MKDYIVCIEFTNSKNNYSVDHINESELSSVINAYKLGNRTFTISGITLKLSKPTKFKIYKISNNQQLSRSVLANAAVGLALGVHSKKYTISFLQNTNSCEDVTANYIGNLEFGELKRTNQNKSDFISKKRIDEISAINKDKFDLTKVLQLCKEINDAWKHEHYISVGILLRALKDHIPPIFNCKNFSEVSNNYGNGKNRSFSGNMKNLENSSKHISDKLIHSQIKKTETLPNEVQVNFSADVDVLLEEIVRILK